MRGSRWEALSWSWENSALSPQGLDLDLKVVPDPLASLLPRPVCPKGLAARFRGPIVTASPQLEHSARSLGATEFPARPVALNGFEELMR